MADLLTSNPFLALGLAIAGLVAFFVARSRRNESSDLSGVPVNWQPSATRAGPEMTPPAAAPGFTLPNTPPFNRLTPDQSQAISREVAAGNKIKAIKFLRVATGLGLKESKEAIETIRG